MMTPVTDIVSVRSPGFFAKVYSLFGVLLLLELCAQFYFIAAVFVQLPTLTQDLPVNAAGFDTFLIPLTTLALLAFSLLLTTPGARPS